MPKNATLLLVVRMSRDHHEGADGIELTKHKPKLETTLGHRERLSGHWEGCVQGEESSGDRCTQRRQVLERHDVRVYTASRVALFETSTSVEYRAARRDAALTATYRDVKLTTLGRRHDGPVAGEDLLVERLIARDDLIGAEPLLDGTPSEGGDPLMLLVVCQ